MASKKRWVLLEHSGLPDGIHFDLLVEDKNSCRTWRLPNLLILDGPSQAVTVLSPHNLYWLERTEGSVSGGRGFAKRILFGLFVGDLPTKDEASMEIDLYSEAIQGRLLIKNGVCRFFSVPSLSS